ncbi:MAG TPA: methylenetetrahydrofolate reductase [NAD(P)H] [Anaerolineae bacterium]|nr:methylenetetrahydrofolate reductase [NAD(P)H] [Anaerolineae bacterium]
MKISEFYPRQAVTYSFEVFPPRTDRGVLELYCTIAELKDLGPSFVSVTFCPDRSNRDRTFQIAAHVKNKLGLESMFHFTCIGASEEQIVQDLDVARDLGLENVLALRGDRPEGALSAPANNTFRYAYQLVLLLKERYDFGIGVAGYPEGHVECPDKEQDLQHLKEKVDAGGEFVITQIFFDNGYFYDVVERAQRIGIDVPIIPGILPILNLAQVNRFAALAGATLPPNLARDLERLGTDDEAVRQLGIDHATQQCLGLLERGVPGIHFYCLNRTTAVREIFKNLGPRWCPGESKEESSIERLEAQMVKDPV